MPIRIEKRFVNGKIEFHVIGIQWGGSRPTEGLEIQFNPEENYVPVEGLRRSEGDSWNFWRHIWTPQKPGTYLIRLRLKRPQPAITRVDSGYYVRAVEIQSH
jgi:hypothetical protein